MEKKYILSIDQSTQGTKALLFDEQGELLKRSDLPHEQIINEAGWVSHNMSEIYDNTIQVIKRVIESAGISKSAVHCIGISNQRETAGAWNKQTGEPVADAIVWQCSRAREICERMEQNGYGEKIRKKTGIHLSPYFPASKIAWLLENVPEASQLHAEGQLCIGTIDSWLIYKLTSHQSYKTDYSNASRTQLFNIKTLKWDKEICSILGINPEILAEVCDSNANFGYTDLDGYLDKAIPIRGVLGDSHGALFGQGCLRRGMAKTTYGTGSSVMMNIGEEPVFSDNGVVTSLAWGIDGQVNYVLEGNINYTGAVISWLQNDLKIIASAQETEKLARAANNTDTSYLVPAFTGLGAPYWDSQAKAMISGITRVTGQAEIVRAALDCIAYQITDIVEVMCQDAGVQLDKLCVDGGPTRNNYLMQFQSDMARIVIEIPAAEELSGIGAAYMAGISAGLLDYSIFEQKKSRKIYPRMDENIRKEKYRGWKEAVKKVTA